MRIRDINGREIVIGANVVGGGRVVGITEPDADYNSYGRAVMYGPYVKVLYPEGEDKFVCTPEYWSDFENFICDDVALA